MATIVDLDGTSIGNGAFERHGERCVNGDETPTPKASGLWREWAAHATTLAARLELFAGQKRRQARLHSSPGRLELLDLSRAKGERGLVLQAETLAVDATSLALSFRAWGSLPPPDEERVRLIQRLATLQRVVGELVTGGA